MYQYEFKKSLEKLFKSWEISMGNSSALAVVIKKQKNTKKAKEEINGKEISGKIIFGRKLENKIGLINWYMQLTAETKSFLANPILICVWWLFCVGGPTGSVQISILFT
ncbi:hypothetical protein HPG69_000539 [Diceros bicornis minor]|uniref:Uncharacterized protein n=1 Tax=Diceros bicornis minor TaxID=77932 RepID=A0A7J7FHT0_DICBM|nr:hypothetical protein HPG69_000539 [Diceros bicornis minor]